MGAFAKRDISEATGVPFENIMLSATHMHSGPELTVSDVPAIDDYKELLRERLLEAAVAAMADRKSATMSVTTTELTNMNFVRHYVMSDGSVVGDGFGETEGLTYIGHVSQADNQMHLVRFQRQCAKDVIMVNWQTHPHRAGSALDTNITSDIVGSMRSFVEAQLDCNFICFSGASGNLNPSSRIGSENCTWDYLEQGQAMGKQAILALSNMTELATGKVQMLQESARSMPVKKKLIFPSTLFPSAIWHSLPHPMRCSTPTENSSKRIRPSP